MHKQLSDFIEASNAAQSPAEAVRLFGQATSHYGFSRIAYANLTEGTHNRPEMPGFLVSYPGDWVNHYFEQGYERIDPSTQHLFVARGPFTWDSIPRLREVSKKQANILAEAGDAGLNAGLSIPLHGPMGDTG